ncbi:MAG: hypothetical protein IAG10_32055 [Planctomycetaceae bacterium]|nr:hypothetical protein [Planctomycetaceae bacterium]
MSNFFARLALMQESSLADICDMQESIDIRERADKWLREVVAQAAVDARESAMSFYRTIVALASGATVISLTLVEKILPKGQPQASVVFLFGAWWCFALSLVSVLIAFLLAARQYRITATALGRMVADLVLEPNYSPRVLQTGASQYSRSRSTYVLQVVAVGLFALGMMALVLFASCNYTQRDGRVGSDLRFFHEARLG